MSSGARANERDDKVSGIIPSPDTVPSARYVGKKKDRRLSKSLLTRTLILLAVCGIAAFAVLAHNLYQIQVVQGSYFESRTLGQQLRQRTITASRGTIYDSAGRILAKSGAVENVFLCPLTMYNHEQDVALIAQGLSRILEVDADLILSRAGRTRSQYELIKRNITENEGELVRAFISEHGLRGIHFEPSSQRVYPNDSLASHILGFVGTDNSGLEGVEHRLDAELSGVNGRMIRLTNARGTDLMLAGFNDYFDARDGNNVFLTIDLAMQYYVEKHLEQAIIDYDARDGGIAIAMDPRTGAILAMANYPNFDPNDFLRLSDGMLDRLSEIEDEAEFMEAYRNAQFSQWRNNAFADAYEPGSVFKVLTWAMALEENKTFLDETFHCDGQIAVRLYDGTTTRNCVSRWGHGHQTLSTAMYSSCNVVCIELAVRVGARTFYDYVAAFGLFDRTGIDNSVEARSIWWDDRIFLDPGNHTQLASASFGQTFKVTPIQMITAVAATINGGYLMQPRMIDRIEDESGNIVEINEPIMHRQVISNETSAIMRTMLEGVVTDGTGRNAQVMGYSVGGKTGTSENIEQISQFTEDGEYEKEYIVSFVGFAPADDPEIVILVLLNNPSHDTGIRIGGGSMAAPVVGRMLADILPMTIGILPHYSEYELPYSNQHVPRIIGLSTERAAELLVENGFNYTIVGDGNAVTAQLPARNAFIASGSTVIIYAGDEPPREQVSVPYVGGMTYSEARQALEYRGLFIRTTGVIRSDPNALVSVQSIPAGRDAMFGSIVEVTLINSQIVELRVG